MHQGRAAEPATGADAPPNTVSLTMAPQSYLVFPHPRHIATLRETCDAIWSDWLPAGGGAIVEAPRFERYGPDFDPVTGASGPEVWIPVSG